MLGCSMNKGVSTRGNGEDNNTHTHNFEIIAFGCRFVNLTFDVISCWICKRNVYIIMKDLT